MTKVRQINMSGGEITPALWPRIDTSKGQSGFKTLRNFYVRSDAASENRQGSGFKSSTKGDKKTFTVEFEVLNQDSLALEFTDMNLRVLRRGIPVANEVTETLNITGITKAAQAVLSYSGTDADYDSGDEIILKSIVGMDELNDRVLYVSDLDIGANTMKLKDENGVYIDSSTFDSYISGGTVQIVLNIPVPYTEADIPFLDYGQSIDVINFVHENYPPREFVMTAYPAGWETNEIQFSDLLPPMLSGLSAANIGTTGSSVYFYAVTAIDPVTGEETIDSNVQRNNANANLTVNNCVALTWTPDATDITYNVYKLYNGVYGLIGVVRSTGNTSAEMYRDIGVVPNTSATLPDSYNPFDGVNKYPKCFTYFQQRTIYGGTNAELEKVFASRTGLYNKFIKRIPGDPIRDDDSIEFQLAGTKMNPVDYLMDLNGLVMFTDNSEQYLGAGPMTPSTIHPQAQSYNGVRRGLKPIGLDSTAIYAQKKGRAIRELGYVFESSGYRGDDLTTFSKHLFKNREMVSWAHQKEPHSIVWIVRDDGLLVSMTHVKEQEILALSRHDFEGGAVENVYVLSEGNDDIVYVVVRRTVNGVTKRFHERMPPRELVDISSAKFMDCHREYDGWNTDEAKEIMLSGGDPDWDYETDIAIESNVPLFDETFVGDQIHIKINDVITRVDINEYASNQMLIGRATKTVPEDARLEFTSSWARAKNNVKGLYNLEGKQVSVFADGYVVGSVHNSTIDAEYQVANGRLTLDKHYAQIVVGLPITADMEPLDLDNPQGETLIGREKLVSTIDIKVEETRGIFAGTERPTGDDAIEGLYEVKPRKDERWGDPNRLITGEMDANIQSRWDRSGSVFLRQVDPLPATICGFAPSVDIGG